MIITDTPKAVCEMRFWMRDFRETCYLGRYKERVDV